MLLDVLLAASATPAPAPAAAAASGPPWVFLASLVTGLAAIGVALYGGRVQARIARESADQQERIAASDRQEARDREDRARADEREREKRNREDQRLRDERAREDQRERDHQARMDQEARDDQAREDQRQRDERTRKEERDREDRLERASAHEAIAAELSQLSAKYGELGRQIEQTGDDSHLGYERPDSKPLLRALDRLVVRFGEVGLSGDAVNYYGTALRHTKFADMYLVMATLQDRLAGWFLHQRTTLETRRLLRADAELLAAGGLPSPAPVEDLPAEEPPAR